ncbi:hypothetical protein ACGFW5_17825 [Streptomyces sp. NPDC048416]|uniref:hypothetical protein n=1 Tax=Streptomyces sp. NPDC048416 TaxID=3365546 RepID=UPI00371C3D44
MADSSKKGRGKGKAKDVPVGVPAGESMSSPGDADEVKERVKQARADIEGRPRPARPAEPGGKKA